MLEFSSGVVPIIHIFILLIFRNQDEFKVDHG